MAYSFSISFVPKGTTMTIHSLMAELVAAVYPARNAHLLSTLTLNLLRAELTSEFDGICPLAPLLATQKVISKLVDKDLGCMFAVLRTLSYKLRLIYASYN
jgi:hypothetical protein